MTTEERAKAVHESLTVRSLSAYNVDVKLIADAIRAAVLEEREAAAKVAEAAAKKNEYCPPGCKCGNGYHIALAIRGRE